ncbi:MAG: hypothetical protein MNPFHGCM_03288 [Gemmatimonadaceae bacterium]|nr:hypothetical protein [Gemmatimonadaceae bacterium]
MTIIPIVRCDSMRQSLAFYIQMLGFERIEGDDDADDPSFCVLSRDGDQLYLSSHPGDGKCGQAIVMETDDVDGEWQALRRRGLRTPGNPESPVHDGPVNQTWGSREFYVDDPDGNTIRFVQWK